VGDDYLAERRTDIREGWTPGECELCGANSEVSYICALVCQLKQCSVLDRQRDRIRLRT
jgi:hypothetical protein